VGPEDRDRVRMPVARPRGRQRMVGAEEEDRAGVREQAALVGRQRTLGGGRQALVRVLDAAAKDEVPDRAPDDEEEDDQDERDGDLAAPADLPRPARCRLRARPAVAAAAVALGSLAPCLLRAPSRRDAALGSSAAVEAIGLLSAGG